MCLVNLAKTILVNFGYVYGDANNVTIEPERWAGCRVRESTTRLTRLR
jgi:hypothetical protein